MPIPDNDALHARLRTAIENSRKKGYHGNDDNMNKLPTLEEQAKDFLLEKGDPFDFYSEETKEWLPADSPKWHLATLEKFSWIKQLQSNTPVGEELLPRDFALNHDDDKIQQKDFTVIKNKFDRLRQTITSENTGEVMTNLQNTTVFEDYPAGFTWRDLFLKLVFEQMLQYFPQHQDFKLFYKYIDEMGPLIHTLRLKILDKRKFKSNNYYLMALIGRMPTLKVLKMHKDSLIALGVDGFKYL